MMDQSRQSDREPRGVTTLDLLLLVAGFAFGLVLHQASDFGHGRAYILPSGPAQFRSLLGRVETGWVWALVVGLAAVVVARRFRYGGPIRAAEWLAVSLAIDLFDSAFLGFRPMDWGRTLRQEVVWMDWSGHGSPVALYFWSADTAHPREYLTGVALRMAPVAMLIGITAWVLRTKIGPGWVAVLAIAVAVLVTLGPIRLAEAMSTEVSSSAKYIGAYRPRTAEGPWTRMGLALYLDARAWAGYSIRALWLTAVAILAVTSLLNRGRRWLWTEWAGFASASVLACCWAYDECAARPAIDRTARVIFLATWLLLLGLSAGALILARATLGRPFMRLAAKLDRARLTATVIRDL